MSAPSMDDWWWIGFLPFDYPTVDLWCNSVHDCRCVTLLSPIPVFIFQDSLHSSSLVLPPPPLTDSPFNLLWKNSIEDFYLLIPKLEIWLLSRGAWEFPFSTDLLIQKIFPVPTFHFLKRKKLSPYLQFVPQFCAVLPWFCLFYSFCLTWTEFRKRLCGHSFCTWYVYEWHVVGGYVCSVCVCVFSKIDHCIHIHWCIPMGLEHNDPWVESHMWTQQTWGQRSSRGQWPLVQVFTKRSLYPHKWIFMGRSYNDPWVESHMWP